MNNLNLINIQQDQLYQQQRSETIFESYISTYKQILRILEIEDPERQNDSLEEKQYLSLKVLTEKTVQINDNLKDIIPENIVFNNNLTIIIIMNMAELCFLQNKDKECEKLLQICIINALNQQQLFRCLRSLVFMGLVYQKRNDFNKAEDMFQESLKYSQQEVHYNQYFALQAYANFLGNQKRFYEQDMYIEQSIEISYRIKSWDDKKENFIIPDYVDLN